MSVKLALCARRGLGNGLATAHRWVTLFSPTILVLFLGNALTSCVETYPVEGGPFMAQFAPTSGDQLVSAIAGCPAVKELGKNIRRADLISTIAYRSDDQCTSNQFESYCQTIFANPTTGQCLSQFALNDHLVVVEPSTVLDEIKASTNPAQAQRDYDDSLAAGHQHQLYFYGQTPSGWVYFSSFDNKFVKISVEQN